MRSLLHISLAKKETRKTERGRERARKWEKENRRKKTPKKQTLKLFGAPNSRSSLLRSNYRMAHPPPPPPMIPQPTPLAVISPPSAAPAGVQVRCAGCNAILTVAPGITEFICPTCKLPQMLPPELMSRSGNAKKPSAAPPPPPRPPQMPTLPPPPMSHVPAHGIDPTKIQLPCVNCKAILNVPHGLARFSCPQCGIDLAVDHARFNNFFAPRPPPPPLPLPAPPLPMLMPNLPSMQMPGVAPLPAPAMPPPEEVNEVRSRIQLSLGF